MSLKVAIFEDDKELADYLKEMMETKDFEVTNFYNIKEIAWKKSDIVLGDYRNQIVNFNQLVKECQTNDIPIIAISGAETGFTPQLLKPFLLEELQSAILQCLMNSGKFQSKNKESFLFSIFRK